MKNLLNKKIAFSILAFVFSIALFAQERHEIVLTCTTSDITERNVNEVCSFGQNSDITNEEYTVDVGLSDIVVWKGRYSEPNMGQIEITNIVYEDGVNIFKNRNIHDREDGRQDGNIVAIVKQGEQDDFLKYIIKFDVYKEGGAFVGRFSIDPKLRVIRHRIER